MYVSCMWLCLMSLCSFLMCLRVCIPPTDWMDDATKKQAVLKENMLKRLIGYPDEFSNYTSVPTHVATVAV